MVIKVKFSFYFFYLLTSKLIPKPNVERLKMIAPKEISLTKDPGLSPSLRGAPPKNPAEMKIGDINKPMRSSQTAQS